jgi:tetratricopeptide (TPR) repeat protein
MEFKMPGTRFLLVAYCIVWLSSFTAAHAVGLQRADIDHDELRDLIETGDWAELSQQRLILRHASLSDDLLDRQRKIFSAAMLYLDEQADDAVGLLRPIVRTEASIGEVALFTRVLWATSKLDHADEAIQLLKAHKALDKSDLLNLQLAAGYLTQGDLVECVAHATRAIEINSENPDAWYYRAFARWKQGRVVEAVSDIEKGLQLREIGPFRNEELPHMLLGIHHFNEFNLELAIAAFVKAGEYGQGKQEAQAFQFALLAKRLNSLAQAFHIVDPDPEIKGLLVNFLSSQDPNAVDSLGTLARTHDTVQLHCLFALTLAAIDQAEKAVDHLRELTAKGRDSDLIWTSLASIFYVQEDFAQSLDAAEKALAINGDNIDALYFQGFATWQLASNNHGLLEEAVEIFKQAIAIRKVGPFGLESQAYYFCGMYFEHQGQMELAIESYTEGAKIGCDSRDSLGRLWYHSAQCGDLASALATARQLELEAPEHLMTIQANAMSLITAEEHEAAKSWIDRWIAVEPENATPYEWGAHSALKSWGIERGLKLVAKARELSPKTASIETLFVALAVRELGLESKVSSDGTSGGDDLLAAEALRAAEWLCETTHGESPTHLQLRAALRQRLGRY